MIAFAYLFASIPSAVSVGAASYMAINGVEGWGWFLFVGFALGGISFKDRKS